MLANRTMGEQKRTGKVGFFCPFFALAMLKSSWYNASPASISKKHSTIDISGSITVFADWKNTV
jgi:hypothetical protein